MVAGLSNPLLRLAELAKPNGVHFGHIRTLKRAVPDKMVSGFTTLGEGFVWVVRIAQAEKRHSKSGQLLVEWNFVAYASRQIMGK